MKTAQELKEEIMDKVFDGIKKDKRDELINNLSELSRLARIKGIYILDISIIDYYREIDKVPPSKLLGMNIKV